MYTEGYIKKIECFERKFWLEPTPPYCLTKDGENFILAIKNGPLVEQKKNEAIVCNSAELSFSFCCDHLPVIVTLKTTHCRIGVSYDDNMQVTEITTL